MYTYTMPRVNIYIRKKDYPVWMSIKDKPEAIHRWITLLKPLNVVEKGYLARPIPKEDEDVEEIMYTPMLD